MSLNFIYTLPYESIYLIIHEQFSVLLLSSSFLNLLYLSITDITDSSIKYLSEIKLTLLLLYAST